MPERRQTFVQKLVRWRFLFVVNLLVVLFLSVSLGREVVRNKTIETEITTLETQAEELVRENAAISELQSALRSESYIEREARLKLGMKKEGETVVVVKEGDGSVPSASDPTDPLDIIIDEHDVFVDLANPTKWWYYFFDKLTFEAVQRSYE